MNSKKFKYQGALHIHTNKSDGTGKLSEVVKAAKKSGLSWIIITDHNYIDCEEGYIDGVCVIKGQEVSPKHENHYLVFGCDNILSPENDLQNNIDTVRKSGGFGFAAHPDESDTRKNNAKPIKWLDKNIKPDGIEIWNWFSSWADNYDSSNIFTVIYSYLFKNKLVGKPYSNTVCWWDKLNRENDAVIPAVGGVDAHALIIKKYIIPVKIFPYEFCFNTIVNEIILDKELSSDFLTAKKQILNALKSGNNTIINKQIGKDIFDINISDKTTTAYAGESIDLDDDTYLNISLPKCAKIFVFKDGLLYNKITGDILKIRLSDKGKYRIEVELKNKGYAYTNPIIVK